MLPGRGSEIAVPYLGARKRSCPEKAGTRGLGALLPVNMMYVGRPVSNDPFSEPIITPGKRLLCEGCRVSIEWVQGNQEHVEERGKLLPSYSDIDGFSIPSKTKYSGWSS